MIKKKVIESLLRLKVKATSQSFVYFQIARKYQK